MGTANESKKTNVWKSFIPLLASLFVVMTILGMNTPAYPFISVDLGIDTAYIAWMSVFYTLPACVLAPLTGRIGDTIGLKKVILAGLVIFAGGCLVIAFSISFPMILAGRFIQGIGFASIVPSAMAFVGRFFAPEKLGFAYSIYGGTLTAGPVVGPLIAGFMVSSVGWRPMFTIGGVVVALAFLVMMFAFPKLPIATDEKKKFDAVGTVTLFIAIGSLLLMPTLSTMYGWGHPLVLLLIALFLVFGIIFIITENKVGSPLIKLSLVKSRGFFAPTLLNFSIGAVLQALLYMMSFFLVAGLGLTSSSSGIWTAVVFLTSTLVSMILGGIIIKFLGTKKAAFVPVALLAISVMMFSTASSETPMAFIMIAGVILGAAVGFSAPITMAASMSTADPQEQGSAAGTYRMINDLGGPLGTQVFVTLFSALAITASGVPNYVGAFPEVCRYFLIVVAFALVMVLLIPGKPKDSQ